MARLGHLLVELLRRWVRARRWWERPGRRAGERLWRGPAARWGRPEHWSAPAAGSGQGGWWQRAEQLLGPRWQPGRGWSRRRATPRAGAPEGWLAAKGPPWVGRRRC